MAFLFVIFGIFEFINNLYSFFHISSKFLIVIFNLVPLIAACALLYYYKQFFTKISPEFQSRLNDDLFLKKIILVPTKIAEWLARFFGKEALDEPSYPVPNQNGGGKKKN